MNAYRPIRKLCNIHEMKNKLLFILLLVISNHAENNFSKKRKYLPSKKIIPEGRIKKLVEDMEKSLAYGKITDSYNSEFLSKIRYEKNNSTNRSVNVNTTSEIQTLDKQFIFTKGTKQSVKKYRKSVSIRQLTEYLVNLLSILYAASTVGQVIKILCF